jgi:predicted Co/Zn/Cd cation transporter (cation efflux family)
MLFVGVLTPTHVGVLTPTQQQAQFLLPTVAEYPALIEQLQNQIEVKNETCQYITRGEAVGTTVWLDLQSTEPSCRERRELERRLERARNEFKARLCK